MNAPISKELMTGRPSSSSASSSALPRRRRRRGQRDADRATHDHASDRWMVSYADFITLLFAFFVVMYATSSVNENRYRTLSGALATAFSPDDAPPPYTPPAAAAPGLPIAPIAPVAKVVPASVAQVEAAKPPPVPEPRVDPKELEEIARNAERAEHMRQLASRMGVQLQALAQDGQVQVTRGAHGIAIEINAALLFDPAKADLKPAAFDALRSLAAMLGGFVEPLQIEGHSDDLPIATREFRSNWELSAARAASVGRFLIDQGVAPGRVGIAGYAEFRPRTANADAASRARNRRVTIVVLSADDTRPQEGAAAGETTEH